MTLLAFGLNHHTAPVEIRERVAIGTERVAEALKALRNVDAVNEAAIVSTCNRTEFYCGMQADDPTPVIDWMHRFLEIRELPMTPYLFQHADREVVHHLMRVCSGLDSMVLGEPQILGQIKQAYRNAAELGTLGSELGPLFESAFSVAKRVRTETAIGNSPVSVAFAAVSLARRIFADFSSHGALLIGAGETIQLAARHLRANGIGTLQVANRTRHRAANLAREVNGRAIALPDIPEALPAADIIISSTASPLPILGKGLVEKAMKARRYRPMLVVDIAVPRDVEPEVLDIDNVFLYTVDDLADVIEDNRQSRRLAADEAEQIVLNQVELFMRRTRALGADELIRAFRSSVESQQQLLLERALRQLEQGQPADEVARQLAHRLSNKFMHTPTARLRDAAVQGNNELLESARILLDLPPLPK